MNFQNEGGLFTDGARVIRERCLVSGADFAQFRTARFQNFANAKASADLDQLAARNNHFIFSLNNVANNQNQRGRAVVDDCGSFRLAEEGESALEVATAITAIAGCQVELQVTI